MPYDVTEMRARLSGFMREINDLSTSREDVERYASFNAALYDINEQTEYYYQPLPNGSYPTLDAEGLKKLQASYEAALEQTGSLLAGQGGGAVAERMRGIVREMAPLLQSDRAALDMAGGGSIPLPELIGRAREQAVDLGAQQTTSQSGQLSSRQHIYVENNGVTEDGYFTATSRVEPDKKYQQLMDQLQSKYPPQYRPLIDGLRGKYQDAVEIDYSGSPYWGMGGDTPEETRDAMRATWRDEIHGAMGTDGALKEVGEDAQYLSFMDDFYSAMRGISAEYTSYKSGKLAVCEDGANIDRRNVGMSRVAGMLGKPELVANARPMMLIQNGVAVSGTFMQTADGVDLTNTKPTDPIRGYQTENFNNPEVFDDIAAMQGIDFICGNIDRHPGNFFMRFNPRDGEKGKLVGITLIDNDLSFSNATASAQERTGSKFVLPDEMGVIGEDFYNAMRVMTKEQLQASLSDCGLSAQEIDWAWQRKEALQAKIEKDLAYFQDKESGYIEAGRLRMVPKAEWGAYSIQKLAEVHKDSQFQAITRTPETAKTYENKREQERKKAQEAETVRREALGLPPEVEKSAPKAPTPVGKVVGSGLAHESDPLNIAREGTLKLASPGLSHIKPVGNNLSRRYPISWNADGKEHKGFLTPELSIRADATVRQSLDIAIEQNPQYADVLGSIRNYYTFDQETRADKVNLTGKAEKLPWEEMGIEADRVDALMKDSKFERMWQETAHGINKALGAQILYGIAGVERGRRIDLRNVAMSDVGDVLGVPDLLARSSTVQLEADGRIIEGVVMEAADGFEFSGVKDGEPMARITAEQASEVYNTESGVKSLADMQILDYVCMNRDRHKDNMFYRFEGLESGRPRFVGVQGIDNDYSFGTHVPQPAEYVDKLSSLNDMQVISAGMAAKIRAPGTKEAIAEKMKQNGMSQSEIEAAWKRVDAVQAQMDSGKMRIVQDGEWGKGPNTIEKLSEGGSSSIFRIVKRDVIDKMAERAAKWEKLPEDKRKAPEPSKSGLTFAKCAKVENFGKALTDNTELKTLREQAKADFSARIAQNAVDRNAPEPISEKDALANILAESRAMSKRLADADPLFHGRSSQYRSLRNGCSDLEKLAQRLGKKLKNPEDELSAADRQKLTEALNKVGDRAAAYQMKKAADSEKGKEPSEVGVQRLKAAGSAGFKIAQLRASYDKTVSAREAQKNPMSYVHNRLRQSQAELSGATGMELRRKTAETIYLKAIAQSEMKFKNGTAIQTALRADTVAKNRDEIMRNPAFARLAKMPDNELRALAAQQKGDKLMDRFVDEAAKDMKAQKSKQAQEKQREKQPIKQPKQQQGQQIE